MRSTVIIDDELFKRAKRRAAAMNTTLSAIVNQALRQALDDEPVHQATRFEIVAFGDPTEAVHHDPADFVAALEDDDRRSLR